jgi:hypothetical protein
MKIELTPKHITALENLNNRYYFGLFQLICKEEEEEYQFRDAIQEIVEEINRQRRRNKDKKIRAGQR